MSYTLSHPDSSQEIEVETKQVPLYLAQGWQTKPGAKTPETTDGGPVTTVLVSEQGPELPPESTNSKAK